MTIDQIISAITSADYEGEIELVVKIDDLVIFKKEYQALKQQVTELTKELKTVKYKLDLANSMSKTKKLDYYC